MGMRGASTTKSWDVSLARPLPGIPETSAWLLEHQRFSNGMIFDSCSEFWVKRLPSFCSKHLESESSDGAGYVMMERNDGLPLWEKLLHWIDGCWPQFWALFRGWLTLPPRKAYGHSQPICSQNSGSYAALVSFQMQASQVCPPTGPQGSVGQGFYL